MKPDDILGFLGYGNMGRAIARGLMEQGAHSAERILVFDVDPTRGEEAKSDGVELATSIEDLCQRSTVLVLAVKPQTMDEALRAIKPMLSPHTLVISIAAGISTAYISERLGSEIRVVRVMPNTPAMVRAGAAAAALNTRCTAEDAETVRGLFEAVGQCEIIAEEAMDAVTAVSGSGPAYFFYMVESMVKAGVAEGLTESQAARLAGQTLLGAGQLLAQSGESAATLRDRVTSKGGTTAAALAKLQERGFDQIVGEAVAAAARRSRELGA